MSGGRKFLATATLAALVLSAAAADTDRASLYRGLSVTNGFGDKNRERALAPSLEEVLAKVSGDQRLIGDPRVAELTRRAADYVVDFSYRDLLNNRPPHDEQGTYDRPQYLTADFDPAKIDGLLASLGRKPWPLPRPEIVALFDITPMKGDSFMLTAEATAQQAADMRGALAAAAQRTGMSVQLPPADQIDATGKEAGMAKRLGGDVLLVGKMTWQEGWIVNYKLVTGDKDYHWQVRRVGFDDAFRSAMRGAAQILSGNGQPEASVTAR